MSKKRFFTSVQGESIRTWFLFFLGLFLSCSTFAQTNSIVTLDSNNLLSINGRKIFTIGLSPGPPTGSVTPAGKDALQEFREAGAILFKINQTANWSAQVISDQQAALNWAAQHDMFCWVNLRELSSFSSTNTTTPVSLGNLVDTFKNHPALGLWKNADEAWLSDISDANLQNGYNVIKQHDTNHPVVQTHAPRGTLPDLQPYNNALDIAALDLYPVGYPPGANSLLTNKEISMIGDWASFLTNVASGQHQCWMIEQIAWSGATPPSKTLRFPTFTQERYMAYQAIINGAGGLLFFGGNVTASLSTQDAPYGWNWNFWNTVLKRVVQELGDSSLLATALVTTNSTRPIKMTGTTSPDIEFCVREVPPYLYILASKREGSTLPITFSGLPTTAHNGELLYESPRAVTATNGQFTDWFDPFEVHAYRFTLTNQPLVISQQPQSQTNTVGATVTLGVAATGINPLTYHWQKNAVSLSNQTNATLTFASLQSTDAGTYTVLIGDANGNTLTSSNALLAVSPVIILSKTARLTNGIFSFGYSNPSAIPFKVYASTNTTTWSMIGITTQASPGFFQFSDIASTNLPQRFYQLRWP